MPILLRRRCPSVRKLPFQVPHGLEIPKKKNWWEVTIGKKWYGGDLLLPISRRKNAFIRKKNNSDLLNSVDMEFKTYFARLVHHSFTMFQHKHHGRHNGHHYCCCCGCCGGCYSNCVAALLLQESCRTTRNLSTTQRRNGSRSGEDCCDKRTQN